MWLVKTRLLARGVHKVHTVNNRICARYFVTFLHSVVTCSSIFSIARIPSRLPTWILTCTELSVHWHLF